MQQMPSYASTFSRSSPCLRTTYLSCHLLNHVFQTCRRMPRAWMILPRCNADSCMLFSSTRTHASLRPLLWSFIVRSPRTHWHLCRQYSEIVVCASVDIAFFAALKRALGRTVAGTCWYASSVASMHRKDDRCRGALVCPIVLHHRVFSSHGSAVVLCILTEVLDSDAHGDAPDCGCVRLVQANA